MKVVVTDRTGFTKEMCQVIADAGFELMYHADERGVPFTEEEKQCEVLWTHNAFSYNNMEEFPNLKLVMAAMVGLDVQPLDEFARRGITFCNARGVYDIPISEFVLMRLLEMQKRAYVFEEQKRTHSWQQQRLLGHLNDKKAAVLGTGGIGKQIAKRLVAFDVNVTGYNRSGKGQEYFHQVHQISALADEIGQYDMVIIALPKDATTVNLINADMLSRMKETAILVNVGRGGIVNEQDLFEALSKHVIAAAALDVYETEPLQKDSPLWDLENFYFSPHNSFSSAQNDDQMFAWMMENLCNYRDGKPLKNIVVK